MIPVSFCWDTQKRSVILKWNGFISSQWKDRKISIKALGCSIPISIKKQEIQPPGRLPMRWVYLNGMFTFLTKWKLKKLEGNLSFPDPMVNGILYGWASALQTGKKNQKIHVAINFLGENWWRGEVTISLKILFHHFRRWIFPLIHEIRGKKPRKGGES
jgi:hypothetical protein